MMEVTAGLIAPILAFIILVMVSERALSVGLAAMSFVKGLLSR